MYQINDNGSSDMVMLCWFVDVILITFLIQYPNFRHLTKRSQKLKADTKR